MQLTAQLKYLIYIGSVAECKVYKQSALEEIRFLLHKCSNSRDGTAVDKPHIRSVEQYFTIQGLYRLGEQVEACAFAGATLSGYYV